MKQILQNLSTGKSELVEAPAPVQRDGCLLIDTRVSLISAGTERMLVDFGRSGLVAKARSQPEKVRQVLDKVTTEGFLTTFDAVRSKLGQPIPLGYSNAGIVRHTGGVAGYSIGDRVVSNGPHADVVCITGNLCARIPDGVSDQAASFTVVGSIGLQGIRLAAPTLGEAFVVIGVGLIGLITVQLLRAQGCRVMAIDLDEDKLKLAREFGAETCNPGVGENPVAAGLVFSRGLGVDGVIVTASTKSSDPITQAAQMSRKRGRIVLVGVTGLELNRADFYEKELTFQVSCSYGPGRYDPSYEDKGHDYPPGFVRWTEQRNFLAVLDMMDVGRINTDALITHRFEFDEAPKAYDILTNEKNALGIVLTYDHGTQLRHATRVAIIDEAPVPAGGKPVLGVIGAGNYASRFLIPAFKAGNAYLHTIVSAGGTNAVVHGKKLGFENAGSSVENLLADEAINSIVIATRHNTHARFAVEALNAKKHVFVEKPLAMTLEELDLVRVAHENSSRHLMVGFNRRFAPHICRMKLLLDTVHEPKNLIMKVNAGALPLNHWHYDRAVGGGRIISEGCHFIDLFRHLVGAPIISTYATSVGKSPAIKYCHDKASITLSFADGSLGTIFYLANGAANFPKEQLEVFCAGRVLRMDNYLKLQGWGWPQFKKMSSIRQDKGQKDCAAAFLKAVETDGQAPIPVTELIEVSRVTIEASSQIEN